MAGLKGQLEIGTSHTYALSGGSTNPQSANFPSIANLLSPVTMAKDMTMVNEHLVAAQAAGMRYRLAECNTVSNGGRVGVSDTLAAALWTGDFLFSVAAHGADGVNFHCNLKPGSYSPISWNKVDGTYTVHPMYYGLLAFKAAGQGRLLRTQVKSESNLTAHATLGADGKMRLLLTNKDLTREVAAHLATGRTKGSIVWLTGPSLEAKTRVKFAGALTTADGKWVAGATTTISGGASDLVVVMPAGSAAVVTFD